MPDSGISLDSFRNRMGLAARHQFTVKESDGTYTLARCFFSEDDDEFLYLFRDKSLVKVVSPLALVRLGETGANDDDDTAKIIATVVNAPPVSHKNVLDELKPEPEYSSDNSLPVWSVIPLGAAAALHLGSDVLDTIHLGPSVLATRKLLARYSGFKLDLGIDEPHVIRLFGKPSGIIHLHQEETMYIYYDDSHRQSSVNDQFTFHGMAVVMSPAGVVTECLSDDFFNPHWKKIMLRP
jgi:hypothetical protein